MGRARVADVRNRRIIGKCLQPDTAGIDNEAVVGKLTDLRSVIVATKQYRMPYMARFFLQCLDRAHRDSVRSSFP